MHWTGCIGVAYKPLPRQLLLGLLSSSLENCHMWGFPFLAWPCTNFTANAPRQLHNIAAAWVLMEAAAHNRQPKSWKGKLGIKTYKGSCAHAQEKYEFSLSFHHWLTLRFCTGREWRPRQSGKLPSGAKRWGSPGTHSSWAVCILSETCLISWEDIQWLDRNCLKCLQTNKSVTTNILGEWGVWFTEMTHYI